jgi:hypothetical protein
MIKYIKLGILAACAFAFAGCVEGDFFEPSPEGVVMTGTDINPMIKFAVEGEDATYPVTVSATGPVSEDVRVSIKIDNSLVEAYNKAYRTSYYALPDNATKLTTNEVVIEKGKTSSETSLFSIVSRDAFQDGRIYVVPVTITAVKGGGIDVVEASRTLYIRLATIMDFACLDISNYSMYSNFIFPDEKALELPTYTYEIKCYINAWHTKPEQISRLCSWTAKDESRSMMLRFGENGQDINSLQIVSPGGNLISTTRFAENTWYTLSLAFDGSTLRFYVNGQRDSELGADCSNVFQRFELGMSWESYPAKQYFNGRVAEIRVWDRALSASEIQLGLCGVDPQSEGLRAYWKMNDGEGHIFHDATDNGYDMDWSKTVRDNKGNGALNPFDNSAYVKWLEDDKNRCVN